MEANQGRIGEPVGRSPGSVRDSYLTLADELAAARELYMTFDPDSPGWAIEPELRRLEAMLPTAAQQASAAVRAK